MCYSCCIYYNHYIALFNVKTTANNRIVSMNFNRGDFVQIRPLNLFLVEFLYITQQMVV